MATTALRTGYAPIVPMVRLSFDRPMPDPG
jgi:hypothetical protein